ncbi:DNA-binding protein [Streptosporangium sp. NPDC001559]|uniref:DNA-binding protein n=1 Tax=Streptosporangium sp. NPDC001559 TaxID=3366187 RepID=UPI0036E1FFBB
MNGDMPTEGAATATGDGARELLDAGAVLLPGADGGDERAVALTARPYRHPGLDGRVVVRLVTEDLGVAEDAAAGFLGLEAAGEPVVVGVGLRRSLGFPEWVLVHHPHDGHHALAVVPELERTARQARTKPKAALDAYLRLAAQLAGSVPHFLPTFFEEAGRAFLAAENVTYAAQMFGQARRAEAEHGLPVDEERLDAVFLEFALAGALPVKALSGYAKELAARVPAQEALRRFRGLCVRRTAGGLAPSTQMAGDLRRLAKAAGRDAEAEEQDYLAELLGLPATAGAPLGWWKAHRSALVALGARDASVRGALLNLMPRGDERQLPALWLEILKESGADAGLGEGEVTPQERPGDGAAGWLRRFQRLWSPGWQAEPRLMGLYDLVGQIAGRLRAELAEAGESLTIKLDVDLLDLLLAEGVPVAAPGDDAALLLEPWARGEGQRDLLALAADPRFTAAFDQAADRFRDDEDGRRAVRVLAASPGGRPMLARWMRAVAGRSFTMGLPQLPDALRRLTWLPAEGLVLAAEEVAAVARADLAAELARTLRGGLVDELGWPAWEEAIAALVSPKDLDEIEVADAWPHLVVSGPSQARVIGAEGTVLVHDLRRPPADVYGDPGFHYVDGELLVYWNAYGAGDQLRGYWHSSAGSLRTLQGRAGIWALRNDLVTLPLPGGGRTTGAGVIHQGDTVVPARSNLISDGTSFWVPDQQGDGWREYDPVSGTYGRPGLPGFLADAVRSAPPGGAFDGGWLLPLPSAEATPVAVPVDGLLGWRVVRLPGGGLRGEDLAGRVVTLPGDRETLSGAVTFPGDDRPRALVESYPRIKLVDPEGVVVAVVTVGREPGMFAEGTAMLPPPRYWRCLRPRDPEGSLALRRIDTETAVALLKAAVCAECERQGQPVQAVREELHAQVRALLPQVRDEALIAGIAGVARFAAAQQITLDAVATRLGRALAGGHEDRAPSGPPDQVLARALNGLGVSGPWWYGNASHDSFQQLRTIGGVLRSASADTVPEESPAAVQGVALHFDGPQLPETSLRWEPLLDRCAAVAYRAVSAAFEPGHTEATHELLREIGALGLGSAAEPAVWRRMSLHLDDKWLVDAGGNRREGTWCGVLTLPDGAFIAFQNNSLDNGGCDFTALFHDPSGRFDVPPPYTERLSAPVGEDREDGWIDGLLALWAEHGPAPWRPEAAEEFARLTGVTLTTARLVVAGLPYVDSHDRGFLPTAVRTGLGLKAADAVVARDELRELDATVRRQVVAALLPADPATLWTDGPDVAAAARVWNEKVGRRVAVPEWIVSEASHAVRTPWEPSRALPALLDPASAPELSGDLRWRVYRDRVSPIEEGTVGFTESTLVSVVAVMAWLAHRLPAGDPVRAVLPAALATVRERLANPDLMLSLGRYVNLPGFRKVAGTPSEVADGWERYGAVIMATHDNQPAPGIRMALLDASGEDPYLPALRALAGEAGAPFPVELALRAARDTRFEALLADPGDPAQGERAADGTWWPQDPSRSAPELVSEVVAEYGIGADAATLYLILLAMPDPTDRNVARWTGWKPARLKAARAELAATELVVEASRVRAGRSLFLPGAWTDLKTPRLPFEQWKAPLYDLISGESAQLGVVVPIEPAAALHARAWRRVRDGDVPRFEELRIRRGRRR